MGFWISVRTVEEATAAIEVIDGNYDQHSPWAQEVAREYLGAARVLGELSNKL
jgi:hypothetical protein